MIDDVVAVDRRIDDRILLQRVHRRLHEERHEAELHAVLFLEAVLIALRSSMTGCMLTSLKVVRIAAVDCDCTSRSATRARRRDIGTRCSGRSASELGRRRRAAAAARLRCRRRAGLRCGERALRRAAHEHIALGDAPAAAGALDLRGVDAFSAASFCAAGMTRRRAVFGLSRPERFALLPGRWRGAAAAALPSVSICAITSLLATCRSSLS